MLKLSQIAARKTLNLQICNAVRTIAAQSSSQRSATSWGHKRLFSSALNKQQLRLLDREISAAINLVSRSFNIPRALLTRDLHTSCSKLQQQSQGGGGGQSGQDPKKGKNDKENDKEKMTAVLTKTLLWMLTIYIMVAFFSLLVSGRGGRPDQNPGQTRYISW